MIKAIIHYFDKLEDRIRARLSHISFVYALIGGVCTVLFWRSTWHIADMLAARGGVWEVIFYEPITIIWTSLVLLLTGLFVYQFIGERIIVSGLKNEKKITEKTELEVSKEEAQIAQLSAKISELTHEVRQIQNTLKK